MSGKLAFSFSFSLGNKMSANLFWNDIQAELWKVPGGLKKTCYEKLEIDIPLTVEELRIIHGIRIMGAYGKAHHHKFKLSWQQMI